MSCAIRFLAVREFLRAEIAGEVDFPTARRILEGIASECAGRPGHHVLIDAREADGAKLSPADIYNLVMGLHNHGLGLDNRLALLYQPRLEVDRAKLFEMCAAEHGFQVGAFQDIDEALAWLNR